MSPNMERHDQRKSDPFDLEHWQVHREDCTPTAASAPPKPKLVHRPEPRCPFMAESTVNKDLLKILQESRVTPPTLTRKPSAGLSIWPPQRPEPVVYKGVDPDLARHLREKQAETPQRHKRVMSRKSEPEIAKHVQAKRINPPTSTPLRPAASKSHETREPVVYQKVNPDLLRLLQENKTSSPPAPPPPRTPGPSSIPTRGPAGPQGEPRNPLMAETKVNPKLADFIRENQAEQSRQASVPVLTKDVDAELGRKKPGMRNTAARAWHWTWDT